MVRLTRSHALPLSIAVAGALIVLYQWMGARPLWLDEEMIALNFRDRAITDLGGRLWLDQSAPLGWLVIQRVVLLVFGSSEVALRAVPALFGIATIVAAFLIGQRWLTPVGCSTFVLFCSIGQWISFHAVELKPYSGDTFWALCLPALAAVASGASPHETRRKALAIWAAAAAAGHWFSLGALLVLPACFAVLALSVQRTPQGVRALAAALSFVTASFAVHYLVSIRHTLHSSSLQGYWQFAFPPPDAGVAGSVRWLYEQLAPFAAKPGGASLAVPFWTMAALGFVFAPVRARWLGLASALVVLSGFALAGLRVVPLYERLSLWIVPPVYLGIAMLADRGMLLLRDKPPKRTSMQLASAWLILVMIAILSVDIVDAGIVDLRFGRPRDSNRQTDDRSGVAWLMRQRQPGDMVITTHLGQPAIWWYGGVPISGGAGQQFADGGGIFTAEFHTLSRACRGREMKRVIDGRHRILVYLGFPDSPHGFEHLLLDRLTDLGTVTALQHFPGRSRVAVVDPVPGGIPLLWNDAPRDGARLKGCIALKRAEIW